jgi:3-deoxy-7-phosphoheptulonate synthase
MKEKFPNLFIVMRTYFEKPRTTVGWKWLINDPDLNWSFDIEKWIKKARKFLLDVNKLWLATATEFLDNMTPADTGDLVSRGAIWARTTESQLHREMSSWLSMPIWFKNSTNGDTQIAFDAIVSSNNPHNFIWISDQWKRQIFKTKWNPDWHIILRWWKWITNYDEQAINQTTESLEKSGIETWIIVDCSHANSKKDHNLQKEVCSDISNQITNLNKNIVWVMIESNINEWAQSFTPWKDNPEDLKYWISITDKCSPLDETEKMLHELNEAVWIRNAL